MKNPKEILNDWDADYIDKKEALAQLEEYYKPLEPIDEKGLGKVIDKYLDTYCTTINTPYELAKEIATKFGIPKYSVPSKLEPYQKPPSNHLEVNYIAVGYYKHDIDFGVLCAIAELSKSDFDSMLNMLQTAIKVAQDMWQREHKIEP